MTNAISAALNRQQGLSQEMRVIANNLANSSTTGFKADRAIFAEFIVPTGGRSLSMGGLAGHSFDFAQSGLSFTGGQFDVALQGEGFFVLETLNGQRLTRAGHFQTSADGELVDASGNRVLGNGGGAIQIPEAAQRIEIASDGTLSVDGQIIDQIGIVQPRGELQRDSNTSFIAPNGYEASLDASLVQGALEQSNVSSVLEMARMIEVQRAYEAGQAVIDREDQRISQLLDAVRER